MENQKSFIRLAIAVLLVWILVPVISFYAIPTMDERGQFGDIFGIANALFSGMAFAALYYTLHIQQSQIAMQRTQLDLQREELRLQREEMKASRMELQNQVKMQRALIRATVAQIAVSGLEAEIEADKLDAEAAMKVALNGAEKQSERIREKSRAISALADRLENQMPDAS